MCVSVLYVTAKDSFQLGVVVVVILLVCLGPLLYRDARSLRRALT